MRDIMLRDAAAEDRALAEFVKAHYDELCGALGVYPPKQDDLVLALSRLRRAFSPSAEMPLIKDDVDRARDNVIWAFFRGEAVDKTELRLAVLLLKQSYNALCDRVAWLQRRPPCRMPGDEPRRDPRYPRTWRTRG